jgi:hypothetical protein
VLSSAEQAHGWLRIGVFGYMSTGRHRAGRLQNWARGRLWLRSRGRTLEVTGVAIGLAAGLLAAGGWLIVSGDSGGPDPLGGPAVLVPPGTGGHAARPGEGPDPAVLDAEWAAYSDRSGCADWAGGDGVSAVSLGPSQIAWFFSDTFIGPAGPAEGFSRISGFLHNSVVIQTVTGQGSRFVTLTGGGACRAPGRPTGPPSSVVSPPQAPGAPGDRYWDEDGLAIGGTIVKFYNRYLPGSAPFIPTGTVIAQFPVGALSAAGRGPAYGAVARPRLVPLPNDTPPGGGTPIMWGAALLRAGNTVYVYGTQAPGTQVPGRLLYLARAPASRLAQFAAWQFYAGSGRWAAAQQDAQPVQPPGGGPAVASGFSVIKAGTRYWLIQADPVAGSNDIDAYPAAAPWGPFDPAARQVLYRDPQIGLDAAHDYRIMYEARVEPALSTPHALVISYNVNSTAVTTGCVGMGGFTNTVTLPRFITVPLGVLGGDGASAQVRAGTAAYPHIVAQNPSQWFNGWRFADGCPPVPALTRVQARPRSGAVTLSWPDVGLGVRYQVSVQGVIGAKQQTVRSNSATLSGLQPGSYLATVVPANLRHGTGPGAQVTFTIP